jgi:hypothetical protein
MKKEKAPSTPLPSLIELIAQAVRTMNRDDAQYIEETARMRMAGLAPERAQGVVVMYETMGNGKVRHQKVVYESLGDLQRRFPTPHYQLVCKGESKGFNSAVDPSKLRV